MIWGLKARWRVVGSGVFFCPKEGGDHHYLKHASRRWFTLLSVPLVPTGELTSVIECSSCHHHYEELVLTLPTTEQMARRIEVAARSLLGAVVAIDRVPDPALQRVAAGELAAFLGGDGYPGTEMTAYARLQTPAQRNEVLEQAATVLDISGKEALLAAAARASTSAGALDPDRETLLRVSGERLGMSLAHVEGVLAHALASPG